MVGVHILTFGGGRARFRATSQRLTRQAMASGFFDTALAITDLDLKADRYFSIENSDFVEKNFRGYGYWLWKPYIILRTMNSLAEGDILFYCDAGCEINRFGYNKFAEYLRFIRDNGFLFFELTHFNEAWCKSDLLLKYPAMIGRKQIMATIIGCRVTRIAKDMIADWYDLCGSEGYHLIDDSKSNIENHYTFVEHRHDQSCLNAVMTAYPDLMTVPIDEIERDDHSELPIIISRNKRVRSRILTWSLFGLNMFLYKRSAFNFEIKLFK